LTIVVKFTAGVECINHELKAIVLDSVPQSIPTAIPTALNSAPWHHWHTIPLVQISHSIIPFTHGLRTTTTRTKGPHHRGLPPVMIAICQVLQSPSHIRDLLKRLVCLTLASHDTRFFPDLNLKAEDGLTTASRMTTKESSICLPSHHITSSAAHDSEAVVRGPTDV